MLSSSNRVGIGFFGEVPLSVVARCSKEGESAGAQGIWFAEHVGEGRDAVTSAVVALNATRTASVGTAVINPYTRHPATIAITAATLDELSNGRLILGLGTGNQDRIGGRLGIGMLSPLQTVREAVEIIRRLLDGEVLDYTGSAFTVSGLSLGVPTPPRRVPIYLAAVGDKMIKLCASIGDGVIFSYGCSRGYLKRAGDLLRQGSERPIRTVALTACCVDSDSTRAKTELARGTISYLTRPVRGETMFGHSGLDDRLLPSLRSMGRERAIEELVAGDRVLEFGIAGNPDECREQVEALFSLGIDEAVLVQRDRPERLLAALPTISKAP